MTKTQLQFRKHKFAIVVFLLVDAVLFFWWLVGTKQIAVFHPAGIIATKQRRLIVTAVSLMLLGAIPALFLTFYVAFKYQVGNKSKYAPNWGKNSRLSYVWWAGIGLIILVLSILTWKTAHELDPYKAIASDNPPITIQVVAMNWKWLFIYPEQNIATVNFVEFPENTPVKFELTADGAPMNSFWIPRLGGQMYAMPGMVTHLNLMATQTGEFNGGAAEINGTGFADMKFIAKSTPQMDFNNWVSSVKQTTSVLDYENLVKPSEKNPVVFYSQFDPNLYDNLMMKYMMPMHK